MKKNKSVLHEFKEFAVRGNVVDMLIGITVGAAFGTLVKSLVNDIIMPPIGFLLGRIDFSKMHFTISKIQYETIAEAKKAGAITINYGEFINNFISFLIVAFVVFLLVKQVNKLRRSEDIKSIAPTQKSCPFCFQSISIKASRCPQCTSHLESKKL